MTAHILVPAIDDRPATISRVHLTGCSVTSSVSTAW